ncbi:hypothetical protein N8612_06795, partial [Verrucomicrobia bacterium]|nr:hypothetical protein [Verrucomicrobiota bacterium]
RYTCEECEQSWPFRIENNLSFATNILYMSGRYVPLSMEKVYCVRCKQFTLGVDCDITAYSEVPQDYLDAIEEFDSISNFVPQKSRFLGLVSKSERAKEAEFAMRASNCPVPIVERSRDVTAPLRRALKSSRFADHCFRCDTATQVRRFKESPNAPYFKFSRLDLKHRDMTSRKDKQCLGWIRRVNRETGISHFSLGGGKGSWASRTIRVFDEELKLVSEKVFTLDDLQFGDLLPLTIPGIG